MAEPAGLTDSEMLSELLRKCTNIEEKLDQAILMLDSLECRVNNLEADIYGQIMEVGSLKQSVAKTHDIDKLCRKINDLGNPPKPKPIYIHGIPEGTESDDCKNYVDTFFRNILQNSVAISTSSRILGAAESSAARPIKVTCAPGVDVPELVSQMEAALKRIGGRYEGDQVRVTTDIKTLDL